MLVFLCYQETSSSLVSRLFNFGNYGVHLVVTVLNLGNLQIDITKYIYRTTLLLFSLQCFCHIRFDMHHFNVYVMSSTLL